MINHFKKREIKYIPRSWAHYNNAGDARTQSLARMVPDLYTYQTVLYIGARPDRFDYGIDFIKNNYQVTVLEI